MKKLKYNPESRNFSLIGLRNKMAFRFKSGKPKKGNENSVRKPVPPYVVVYEGEGGHYDWVDATSKTEALNKVKKSNDESDWGKGFFSNYKVFKYPEEEKQFHEYYRRY